MIIDTPMLVLISFTFAVWVTYAIKVIWDAIDRDE